MASTSLLMTLFALLGISTLWYSNIDVQNWLTHIPSLLNTWPARNAGAESPSFITFSEDPLVVYIPNFLTPSEAVQLVDLSIPHFKPSVLWTTNGQANADPSYRSSKTATLPQDNPDTKIIQTISDRARSFPFYTSKKGEIEPLVVQKYGIGEQYRDHYDWFPAQNERVMDGNRESTFFVYIEANCTGGGTNFPRLKPPTTSSQEEEWCKYIDCDRPIEDGVTFKPITGNAIFWRNLKEGEEEMEGHRGTLHAGLPVTSGEKMGLNIWTWERS